jgi:amylosucrase
MAGYAPYEHRKFLKNYYSGNYEYSTAKGALFAVNPKTQDARISGSLASLCGLEFAINKKDSVLISKSIQKILMMQAHCLFLGGIPMLYYGDEIGYTNDYSFLEDENKKSDNRWMHRPLIDWVKNNKIKETGTVEERIFTGTQKLIKIRHALTAISDFKNLEWLHTFNKHVAILLREFEGNKVYCLYNFSDQKTSLVWNIFRQNGIGTEFLYDHWSKTKHKIGANHELFFLEPYEFMILEELIF